MIDGLFWGKKRNLLLIFEGQDLKLHLLRQLKKISSCIFIFSNLVNFFFPNVHMEKNCTFFFHFAFKKKELLSENSRFLKKKNLTFIPLGVS